MRLILNVIWFIFGGLELALGWLFAGVLMCISIVGLPWARACFNIALFTLWPFGKEAIDRSELTGEEDLGTGAFGTLGNLIWIIFPGIWLAIGHLAAACLCAITIIGIPFAVQHLKLARMSLWPIGKAIVPIGSAQRARARASGGGRS